KKTLDKNECQDKPCHWLAKCTNTINSTKCDCFPGFKGNGFECTDVDECADNLSQCPKYSRCVNLPGTFFCNCTTGFMPKSALMPTCIDIDECSTDMHNCGENELCQNTFGSFECVKECSKGYQINGTVCDDVDECLESHKCDKRATCENTNGGYKCICDEGFAGNGHTCS
uniref:EGF-like domain-containing protein n=1 Tax=Panagrolaimus sp. ES5 TaxID=591445 RepID=A0AC34GM18_9BILA